MPPTAGAVASAPQPRFDTLVLCRVIDNFGDAGVAWRLARQLAARGLRVALVLDDDTPLRWMRGTDTVCQKVTVLPWSLPQSHWAQMAHHAQRVIEAFGCTAPDALLAALPRSAGGPSPQATAPVLINLEYLSAEGYALRSHGLASPQQHGAGAGLTRWFYYPGFTAETGGVMGDFRGDFRGDLWGDVTRDAGAAAPPDGPARGLWFAYPHPRWRDWVRHMAAFGQENFDAAAFDAPGAGFPLDLCPGDAQRQAGLSPGQSQRDGALTLNALEYTDQDGFDARLSLSRITVVRGEDSFVRAQWAAQPFVWHIYPQDDGAHWAKLDAFLALLAQHTDPALAAPLRRVWHAFNDPHFAGALPPWPDAALWRAGCAAWRQHLAAQDDLVTRLLDFASTRPG